MVSYLSAVIPTILAVYAQSHFERLLNKVLPEALRNFVTPLVTLAVIVPLTFIVIGPISDWVGHRPVERRELVLGPVADHRRRAHGCRSGRCSSSSACTGASCPVMIQDLSDQGYSLLTGPLFAAVLAQAGAGFAVFLKTKNRDLKEVAGPADRSPPSSPASPSR